MLGLALIFLLPYLWMVFSSMRPNQDIFRYLYPLRWETLIPTRVTLQNYRELFTELRFARFLANSLFVASATTLGVILVNAMGGYAFARLRFPGRDVLFILVLATMLVPFEATVVPLYLVVRGLGLQDTYTALIVPWLASPFAVFMFRQFFQEIPRDLDEAAIIDGASYWTVFRHVIVPNSKPAFVTLGLIQFLWSWDAFFWPLVVIEDRNKQVVQVAIATLFTPEMVFWGRTFAACTVVSLPVIVLFLALQRYYIRGFVLSGLKG